VIVNIFIKQKHVYPSPPPAITTKFGSKWGGEGEQQEDKEDYIQELYKLYPSMNTISMMKACIMRLSGHTECIDKGKVIPVQAVEALRVVRG
jgi:hypothetical protein